MGLAIMRKTGFLGAVIGWLLIINHAFAAGAMSVERQHQIVFQVSRGNPELWMGTLKNVSALRKVFGARQTHIEVVCFGPGVGMLLKSDAALAAEIRKDKAEGVVFAACRNTLRARHLTPADLLPSAISVDSGVAEIIRKQQLGWAYVAE